MLRPTIALLLLASPLCPALAHAAGPLTGHPTVIDGDTIELAGRRIDLYGIDAPEAAQTCETAQGAVYRCGQAASAALRRQIGTGGASCEPRGPEAGDHLVATCRVGGVDLSAWMAAHGHALANRRVSEAYLHEERRAWATHRGLWAGVFEEPADWRRARQRAKALAGEDAAD